MNLTALGRWLMNVIAGGEDSEAMTADRALSYAPVWHCVSKITGAFMIMELELLRMRAKAREVQDNHAAHILMSERPNEYQTAPQFKRQMLCHALLWGNARAYIRRVNGVPVELIPLMPDRSNTAMVRGEKWHATIVDDDDVLGEEGYADKVLYFPDSEVWHVPGLGFDGVKGKSLISLAAQSWGIGLGAERQIAKQYKKGYGGGLLLEAPAGAFRKQEDAKEFLDEFRKAHEGADNAGKIGMLRDGIKANVMAMNNSDAQFIEQRRFQREDAALLFCLEGILGDNSNASYNSLHQKNLAYRVNCLSPWTVAIEHECNRKLLSESERRRGYRFKFDDRTLLRMDTQTLMSVISQGITSRVLNPNEGRELLDYNPYEGGDEYANPAIDAKPDNGAGGASNQPAEQRAMQAMLGNLLSVEAKRCTEAAKNPNDFLNKVEAFYLKWENKLADAIEQLGGDREIATRHCEDSKQRLLDASDCQPDELADAVAKCVESWPNRSNSLIEEMTLCSK